MTRTKVSRRSFITNVSAAALIAPGRPLYAAEQEEPKGGIGGTGIVGTLTDFGSLMINGLRVTLTPDTVIAGPLGAMAEADLAIGQALTVEADADLVAARVFVADPVIGRVKSVDATTRRFWVDGIQAQLDPTAGELPQSGDHVAVSGLWRGSEVIATRLTPTDPGKSALAGVFLTEAGKLPRIGSERVLLPSGVAEPASGAFVVVTGRHQAGAFFVETLTPGRFFGAAGPLQSLSVEGYLDPKLQAPFFEVAGLGHSFDPEAQLSAFSQDRAIFEGEYTGLFEVATAKVLPETLGARREALRQAAIRAQSTR